MNKLHQTIVDQLSVELERRGVDEKWVESYGLLMNGKRLILGNFMVTFSESEPEVELNINVKIPTTTAP